MKRDKLVQLLKIFKDFEIKRTKNETRKIINVELYALLSYDKYHMDSTIGSVLKNQVTNLKEFNKVARQRLGTGQNLILCFKIYTKLSEQEIKRQILQGYENENYNGEYEYNIGIVFSEFVGCCGILCAYGVDKFKTNTRLGIIFQEIITIAAYNMGYTNILYDISGILSPAYKTKDLVLMSFKNQRGSQNTIYSKVLTYPNSKYQYDPYN